MNKENTQYLNKTYPKLYRGSKQPISKSLMRFGFECGDGWFQIIESLSQTIYFFDKGLRKKRIYDYLHNRKVRVLKTKQEKDEFLKEKSWNQDWYFKNRITVHLWNLKKGQDEQATEEELSEIYKCVQQEIKEMNEQFLKLRTIEPFEYTEAIQVKEKFGTLRFYVKSSNEFIDGVIAMAENLSAITCEKCGKPTKTKVKAGWYKTICDECENEQ